MTSKAQTLTGKQLALVFGVTEMTILNWRSAGTFRAALPDKRTTAAIRRWAKDNEIAMARDPAAVLIDFPRAARGPKALKRSATGKLSSVHTKRRAA